MNLSVSLNIPLCFENGTNVDTLDPHIVCVGSLWAVSIKPGKYLSQTGFVVCVYLVFVWLASYLQ